MREREGENPEAERQRRHDERPGVYFNPAREITRLLLQRILCCVCVYTGETFATSSEIARQWAMAFGAKNKQEAGRAT